MDFLIFADKTHQGFPSVAGTTSAPLSLYHAANDLVYVHTGSGWTPAVQPSTSSVYAGYSSASASTQAAIVTNLLNTTSAPTATHVATAIKATAVIANKH